MVFFNKYKLHNLLKKLYINNNNNKKIRKYIKFYNIKLVEFNYDCY